jgi:hypothetical protein
MGNNSTSEKIEMLQHTIDRYDHYYDSINNKGSLLLTLNTFLLGGIITGYYSVKDILVQDIYVVLFILLALICCLISIGYTLWAIVPYLSKQADSLNGSVIYFGNISNISFHSFKEMYDDMTDIKMYEDYLQQVHLLAIGLQKKFGRLQKATFLLAACFLCIVVIGFKILK